MCFGVLVPVKLTREGALYDVVPGGVGNHLHAGDSGSFASLLAATPGSFRWRGVLLSDFALMDTLSWFPDNIHASLQQLVSA